MDKIKPHLKLRYLIILFFAFFAAMFIFGCDPSGIGSADYGTADISGYIMDASSNDAIREVTVMTNPCYDTVLTSISGKFTIKDFALNSNPQEVIIVAYKSGYKAAEYKTQLRANETANVTIFLSHQ